MTRPRRPSARCSSGPASLSQLFLSADHGGAGRRPGGRRRLLPGAHGRSGEIGWLTSAMHPARHATAKTSFHCPLSIAVWQKAPSHRQAARSEAPRCRRRGSLIDGYRNDRALVKSMVAINCLINPDAILIAEDSSDLVDQLAAALNKRHGGFCLAAARHAPSPGPSRPTTRRPWRCDPPLQSPLLPTRFALLKGD